MKVCSYCGTSNPDQNMICEACGAQLEQEAFHVEQTQNSVSVTYQEPSNPNQVQPNSQSYTSVQPQQEARPPKYASGGLIAWAIITLLLCTIPGIVALVYAGGINNCATVEQQNKKISSAKLWCTIGTILGVIALIVNLIGRAS